MVPVPRSISSSCGTALRCDCNELAAINKILQNNKIEIEGFYRLEEISFRTLSVEELFLDE